MCGQIASRDIIVVAAVAANAAATATVVIWYSAYP